MTARPWGGHANGRIPLRELVFAGDGALSGEPQYLHPACADAWRRFVAEVRAELGVGIVITEGFRPLALQQHYWNTLPFPKAARPGTSTHGWALAVDMANYHRAPRDKLRVIGRRNGFSFDTGDRVAEPWHLEYVGSLIAPAAGETTPISTESELPVQITIREKDGSTTVVPAELAIADIFARSREAAAGVEELRFIDWQGTPQPFDVVMRDILSVSQQSEARLAALTAAVSALATNAGASPDAVLAVVRDSVRDALGDLTFTIKPA